MDNNTNEICFNRIRELYKELRILELNKIINYLETHTDFDIIETDIYQGKFGCDNWLGLDVEINNKKSFFISLQPFGENDKNGNVYVVMDRVGIYKYDDSNEKLETTDALKRMNDTYMTLPLNNDDLEILVKELKKRI